MNASSNRSSHNRSAKAINEITHLKLKLESLIAFVENTAEYMSVSLIIKEQLIGCFLNLTRQSISRTNQNSQIIVTGIVCY